MMFNIHSGHIALAVLLTSYAAGDTVFEQFFEGLLLCCCVALAILGSRIWVVNRMIHVAGLFVKYSDSYRDLFAFAELMMCGNQVGGLYDAQAAEQGQGKQGHVLRAAHLRLHGVPECTDSAAFAESKTRGQRVNERFFGFPRFRQWPCFFHSQRFRDFQFPPYWRFGLVV